MICLLMQPEAEAEEESSPFCCGGKKQKSRSRQQSIEDMDFDLISYFQDDTEQMQL